jgi:DNA polymerase-3 subunit alpha
MVVANALYRPGPLGAGVHDMYCNYKHGRKQIKYLHPKMGEALKSTYGMMVFQENIMQVAVKLAGFSNPQSDTLRYAVGKKIPELLTQQKELFIDGCVKNGIEKSIAQKIFEQIDYFSGYGFNKSHSAAYAYLAYQTCWLKEYYPVEFMCNLLTSEINNNDKNLKLNSYIRAAHKMGIVCMPADINKSSTKFTIEKGQHKKTGKILDVLRKPLTMLNGVGSKAVDSIVENQPYENLDDFIKKIDARVVNVRVFTTLVEAGCMDETWGVSREVLLKEYPEKKKEMAKAKKARQKQQEKMEKYGGGSLFGEEFDYSGKNLKF